MWLVLAHSTDHSARWASEALRASTGRPVELLLVESLDSPLTRWVQEVGSNGGTVEVDLADGRRLGSTTTAVLNRLTSPPLGLLSSCVSADAAYAHSELTAFAISWLHGLAPLVVNKPTAQGLCGRWRPPLHWRALGMRAGLPVAPLRLDSRAWRPEPDDIVASTTILTIGGDLLWEGAPAAIRRGGRRLAELSDTAVLGLRFAGADPAGYGWRLLDATPQPDLTTAGEAGIGALHDLLQS